MTQRNQYNYGCIKTYDKPLIISEKEPDKIAEVDINGTLGFTKQIVTNDSGDFVGQTSAGNRIAWSATNVGWNSLDSTYEASSINHAFVTAGKSYGFGGNWVIRDDTSLELDPKITTWTSTSAQTYDLSATENKDYSLHILRRDTALATGTDVVKLPNPSDCVNNEYAATDACWVFGIRNETLKDITLKVPDSRYADTVTYIIDPNTTSRVKDYTLVSYGRIYFICLQDTGFANTYYARYMF